MDLRKLKDQAAAWYKKGKYPKALEAYLTLAREVPGDPRWSLKAGETHNKLGHPDRAAREFQAAARGYASQGFLLKAVAMCNLVLGIDPENQETRAMLDEFHATRFGARPMPAASKPLPAAIEAPAAIELEAEPPPQPRADEATDGSAAQQAGGARRKSRTIPPGHSLDTVKLSEVVSDARREPGPIANVPSEVFVIPLDEELDAMFAEAMGEEQPSAVPEPPLIPPTPLFSSLDSDALRSIVSKAAFRCFHPGEAIVRQGEPGDSLFVLIEGEVVVYSEEAAGRGRVALNRLKEGAFFGEIAVITSFTRTCTVEAASEATVLEISTEVIGDLIDEHPPVLKVLLKFFRDRLVNTLVETSPLFAPFARQDRETLASRFQFLEAEPGTKFLAAGEPADGLYILLCGRLAVDPGVYQLKPGDIFGETSLLTDQAAPYGVTSQTKCWVLKLDQTSFREVIMTHPQVLAYIAEISDSRRQLQNEHPDSQLPLI